ncbi:hypothetical protein [Nocardioides sp.]|uniref:hypothetical protein n=1 Tax=Nocardioides sp. TaxID=35761 RepID=UPI0035688774
MTDELSAEQEAVRRLLSQARHEGPVPPEVAARLDSTLTQLSDGTLARPSRMAAALTDLNAVRRRRRNASRILLAAAAVVVGGVVLGQSVDGLGGGADSAATSTADEADMAEAPRDGILKEDSAYGSSGEANLDSGDAAASTTTDMGGATAPSPVDLDAARLLAEVRLPARLTSANFASDVKGLFLQATDEREQAARQHLDLTKQYSDASEYDCDRGAFGRGALLPVYYDGAPAVLALRPPKGTSQRVDLLECGSGLPVDTVTLTRE